MNDKKNFHQGVRLLIETVQNFAYDSKVQVFETNIRVLGSLLACHQILLNPKWNMTMEDYQNELLTLSIDLADRLLPAFTESATEFPFPRVIELVLRYRSILWVMFPQKKLQTLALLE